MNDTNKLSITQSAEYKAYLMALSYLANDYIAEIRRKFARKAFEMYQNETVRKLVMEYGNEYMKLMADRLSNFEHLANNPDWDCYSLEDSCLNNARHYAETIKFFFEI